jgi:hypothetical protein
MEPTTPSAKVYYSIPNNPTNELEFCFQKAEEGDWSAVHAEIAKDPSLLNSTFEIGPNAGKTILWIAANRFAKKDDEAFEFIHTLFNEKVAFNLEACPVAEEGKNVFWLLCFGVGAFDEDKIPESMSFLPNAISPKKVFIQQLGRQHRQHCNINIAPKEGLYKGVSACLLLSRYIGLPFIFNYFRPSSISYSKIESQNPFGNDKTFSTFLLLASCLKGQPFYADLMLKMLQETAECCDEVGSQILYDALMTTAYKEQKKLIFCLILCGAKLPDLAPSLIYQGNVNDVNIIVRFNNINLDIQNRFYETKALLQDLKTVFQNAYHFYLNSSKIFPMNNIPQELREATACNMITKSFPELKEVPLYIMIRWLRTFHQR